MSGKTILWNERTREIEEALQNWIDEGRKEKKRKYKSSYYLYLSFLILFFYSFYVFFPRECCMVGEKERGSYQDG